MPLFEIAPILTVFVFMLVPIVAIMTKHQQKMALILRQPTSDSSGDSVMRLAAEVRELREMVNQQTVMLDNISETNRRLAERLEQRVTI